MTDLDVKKFADDSADIADALCQVAMVMANGDKATALSALCLAQHAMVHMIGPDRAWAAQALVNTLNSVAVKANAEISSNTSGGEA